MSALSHASNWSVALELFNAAHEDPKVLEQLQVLEGGLIALTAALSKAGAMVHMLTVVHFMLEHQMKVSYVVVYQAFEHADCTGMGKIWGSGVRRAQSSFLIVLLCLWHPF